MGASAKKLELNIVSQAVATAIAESNGDFPLAAKILEDMAKKDRELFRQICEPSLPAACWELMRQRGMHERKLLWSTSNFDPKGIRGNRVEYLARANFESLFDFPLPIKGLPKLGDCTKEQIEEARDFYLERSRDFSQKGKFLDMIARVLKPGVSVSKQVTVDRLEKFYREANAE